MKVTKLVVLKKALLARVSAAKHSNLASTAILMRDFVANLLSSSPNHNWVNKDLNFEFLYKVLTIFGRKDSLASSPSTSPALS